MSVSFTWKPKDPNYGTSWGSGSSLHTALEKAFGLFPITLQAIDIPKLEGMAACGYEDIEALIIAINECGDIVIEAHW